MVKELRTELDSVYRGQSEEEENEVVAYGF